MKLTTRQESILRLIARRPGSSMNYLYTRTSPACVAQGRTRTQGTYNWKGMDRLEAMGLVRREQSYRGRDSRNRPVYQSAYYLTLPGEILVNYVPEVCMGFPGGAIVI